jgi:hypothetical protein
MIKTEFSIAWKADEWRHKEMGDAGNGDRRGGRRPQIRSRVAADIKNQTETDV